MPQRALSKNKPWVYIAADEMSEYDLLAAQQLVAIDPPGRLNNDLAFGDIAEPASTVVSPTKRKRSDPATTEGSPHERYKAKEAKPVVKKLGRPKKWQPVRHMINVKPAVTGDIYDFGAVNPEKPSSSQAANTKTQRSKKLAPRTDVAGPVVNPSSPASKPPHATRRSTPIAAAAEGPESAFLNGRVDISAKPKRKIARPKKQGKAVELTKKSDRKVGRPRKQITTAAMEPKPPLLSTSDHGRRQVVQDPSHAVSSVEEGAKRLPRKPLQATADDVDEDAVSDADEATDDIEEDDGFEADEGQLEQERTDDTEEDDGCEVEDEDIAGDPRSSHGQIEGDMEEYSEQESGLETSSQIDSDDEIVEKDLDLFGQYENWKKVLDAAESMQKSGLKTPTITQLCGEMQKARSLYKKLAVGGTDQDALNGFVGQLQKNLTSIEGQIEELAEHEDRTESIETITDIYGRAIPGMIFLMKRALLLRASKPRGLREVDALDEIIRIQKMIIRLCQKANRWESRPDSTRSIVKPTTGTIFPYIRDTNKVFVQKRGEMWVKKKKEDNARKTAIREEAERVQKLQRAAEVSMQQSSQHNSKIRDHIEKRQQDLHNERNSWRRRKPGPLTVLDDTIIDEEISAQPIQRKGNALPHEWTEIERQELVLTLAKSKHMPVEQRYLAALTNPHLQNMLAQHLHTEILNMKPFLMVQLKSPSWLQSIE